MGVALKKKKNLRQDNSQHSEPGPGLRFCLRPPPLPQLALAVMVGLAWPSSLLAPILLLIPCLPTVQGFSPQDQSQEEG